MNDAPFDAAGFMRAASRLAVKQRVGAYAIDHFSADSCTGWTDA